MEWKLIGGSSTLLLIPLAMIALTGLGLSVASAQTGLQSQKAAATNGSGQYYFEFRSRQAWDYGHTFVVSSAVSASHPARRMLLGRRQFAPISACRKPISGARREAVP